MTATATAIRTTEGAAANMHRPRRRSPEHRPGTTARRGSALVVNGFLVLGVAYMILPLLWLVVATTKDAQGLFGGNAFALGSSFFTNLADLVGEENGLFFRWLSNSLVYAGLGAVVGGFVALAAGYAFDKFQFRGKSALYAFVLVGVLIPNTATVIPLYLLAASIGMTNTMWAVLIPAFCNPFSVYLARVFSAGYLPDETLEAARVDGAGPIRTFFQVAVPMLSPGFVTIALFQFVGVWNNFMLPLIMLQNRELFPASVGISLWQSQVNQLPEYAPLVITGSFVSVIPLVIAFILLQRFWRSGLSAGSVK